MAKGTVKRSRDTIFSSQLQQLADFEFNSDVVGVFEDMINRSVPGYGSIIRNLALFAEMFAKPNSNCYDVGCSLGASTIAMLQGIEDSSTKIIAIDNSPDMIKRAKEFISEVDTEQQVSIKTADVLDEKFESASLVAMNFLLQFIPREQRYTLLENVFNGMNDGACLVLSEKVYFEDPLSQEHITTLHHSFKKGHGYSDLEIAQKRDSIEEVMKLDSQKEHIERLKEIGFSHVQQWYQNTSFVSFYAIK